MPAWPRWVWCIAPITSCFKLRGITNLLSYSMQPDSVTASSSRSDLKHLFASFRLSQSLSLIFFISGVSQICFLRCRFWLGCFEWNRMWVWLLLRWEIVLVLSRRCGWTTCFVSPYGVLSAVEQLLLISTGMSHWVCGVFCFPSDFDLVFCCSIVCFFLVWGESFCLVCCFSVLTWSFCWVLLFCCCCLSVASQFLYTCNVGKLEYL